MSKCLKCEKYSVSIQRFKDLEEAILNDVSTSTGTVRARQLGQDLFAAQEVVKTLEGKLVKCSCYQVTVKKTTSTRK
jgi:hypothetical protein